MHVLNGTTDESNWTTTSSPDGSTEHISNQIPARWGFSVWIIVFSWQLLWLLYGISTIFRKTSYGYLYIAPGYMHPSIYWCFICANVASVITMVLLTFSLPGIALATSVLAMTFMYISLFMSLRRVYIRGPVLIREEQEKEIWFSRLFLHNGLAANATWLTFLALFHFAYVLNENFNLTLQTSLTITLCILFFELVVWFFIDNVLCDKFTRYTMTPYLISVLTYFSIITDDNRSNFGDSNSVIILFSQLACFVGILLKIILLIYKHVKQPLFSDVGFQAVQKDYGTLEYSKLRASDADSTKS